MYYLRNKERGYLGNSPMWWAQGGVGYTDNLDKAEKFVPERAKEFVRENPDKWEAWACEQVDLVAYRTMDSQDFSMVRQMGGALPALEIVPRGSR